MLHVRGIGAVFLRSEWSVEKMEEKVVVITGASSGIGAATARLLSSKGHQVVLAARQGDSLERVRDEVGENALVVETDVTDWNDVAYLREAAIREYGHIDVWINNAGRGIGKKWMDVTEDDFDEIMDVNFRSVFYGIKIIIPYFMDQGRGHLINIASFLGRVPLVTFRSVYNAAKSAVIALTSSLRMDLKMTHPGIHVSVVMPGPVKTDFRKNSLSCATDYQFAISSPLRIQSAEEVAGKIAWLIDNPVPELYTNPKYQVNIVEKYYKDVGVFEESMVKAASGVSS
jgi:NADP-dependent 3-hydroxy acid dehydrogenase YdfG